MSRSTTNAGVGRSTPAWAYRTLLLRGYDTLSPRARNRLADVVTSDEPTGELGAACGVKGTPTGPEGPHHRRCQRAGRARLEGRVKAADTDQTTRLWDTLNAWWPAVEVLITTRVTNARTEAANTAITHMPTGRGNTA